MSPENNISQDKRQFFLDVALYLALLLGFLYLAPVLYPDSFSGASTKSATNIKYEYGKM